MPRPSQYSRGRRAVMQLTLALVLLGALGLATLLARSRERTLAVELAAEPVIVGSLNVRLPKNWTPKLLETSQSTIVMGVEQLPADQRRAREPREMMFQAMATTLTDPADVFRQTMSDMHGRPGRMGDFELLGRRGVLLRYDTYMPIPDDPFGRYTPIPGWFAATVVPHAAPDGKSLGVVIGVTGYDTAGPAGKRLVRQLADGMSVRR